MFRVEQLEARWAMAVIPLPFDQTFHLASLPAASKTIYLDFTGHVATGAAAAAWSSTTDINTPPFSIDADPAFSADELTIIQQAWARVAEDFAPFSINVTTREPVATDLAKSGAGDTRWGVRVVIGDGSGGPAAGWGGMALLNSFSAAIDVPCFVNTAGAGTSASNIGLVASHEVGHTLGLDHHGVAGGNEYYDGHGGNGQTGWGPIMGSPYSRNVTQWSKGEYAVASNSQDDLAIITDPATGHGITYRPDDHRDTFSASRPLSRPAGRTFLEGSGIIERNTDADMFRFTVATGEVNLQVRPLALLDETSFTGANLDVGATLYSADGRVVADMRPQNQLDTRFVGRLTGGTYFVKVFGTGNGDPLVDGYSSYGSLGQYTVIVNQVASPPATDPPLVAIVPPPPTVEGGAGRLSPVTFTVTLSKPWTTAVTVNYASRDGSATLLDSDYEAVSGTLQFAPGETRKMVVVGVVGDARNEGNETFSIELSAASNATIGVGEATATIRNDDAVVPSPTVQAAVYGPGGPVSEGSPATFTIVLLQPAASTIQVGYQTVNGTAVAGQDFSFATGFVTFGPGESSKTVTVSTINDVRAETDESFSLRITRRFGAVQVTTASASASIFFNDGGSPRLSALASLSAAAAISLDRSSMTPLKRPVRSPAQI